MESDKPHRGLEAEPKGKMGQVFWMTGLSGSGKTTLALKLQSLAQAEGINMVVIDGDRLRQGLCADLSFDDFGRTENNRRAAHLAQMLAEQDQCVVAALISPLQMHRELARSIIGPQNFVEVYIDAPLDECARRDVKGHYRRALEGQINNFTGISASYEPPLNPDLHIPTNEWTEEQSVQYLFQAIRK